MPAIKIRVTRVEALENDYQSHPSRLPVGYWAEGFLLDGFEVTVGKPFQMLRTANPAGATYGLFMTSPITSIDPETDRFWTHNSIYHVEYLS